jgi:hypothetical protein
MTVKYTQIHHLTDSTSPTFPTLGGVVLMVIIGIGLNQALNANGK